MTQTAFPSSLAEVYTYDAVGNLTAKTDRKGQTIQYVYDALNRMTHKGYPDSTGVDYIYDLVGKIQHVNDPTGSYGFAYDNMGRLIGTTTQYAFLPGQTYNAVYTYDAASNRTGFAAPDGTTNVYGYDTLNRLSSLSNSLTGQFGFGYDALSRRTSLTRPNGVNTSYSYDSLSRLLSVLHQTGGVTIDGASYTYDNAGNRTSKTNYLNAVTEGYAYDLIYQLTQVTQGGSTTESYSYDLVGNRLSSLGMSPYQYNASNELTSIPGGSYSYDANGSTLSDADGKSYTWDFENRLTSLIVPGTGTTTFAYDPFGRRVYKSSSGVTSIYLYDQGNLVEEMNGSGGVVARYTDTLHIDDPLALARGSAMSYYETDGLGTISSLSNSAGSLSQTYTFDSYGNQTTSSGSLTNPFQFTGREYDTETSLYYSRARYYDPKPGRFLSEDPLAFGQGVNFYAYVGNNPINLIDPTGLAKCCATQYQNDIQKGADNARERLNHLFQFGTAVLPTDTAAHVGAATGCFDRVALYHGQRIPIASEYHTTIKIDPEKHPCDYECAMKHEMVHARACAAMGGTVFNALSEKQKEVPAYMMELGCYLKMQMDNNLGPYK